MASADFALAEMGKLMGLSGLAFDGEGRAALEFDGDFQINIQREDANTVELWAHVSGFGPVSDPVILRHALEGNAVNGTTAGARLALEPEARQFTLCERLRVKDMTGAELEDALHSFLAVLAYWNSPEAMPDRLSASGEGAEEEPADDAVLLRL